MTKGNQNQNLNKNRKSRITNELDLGVQWARKTEINIF